MTAASPPPTPAHPDAASWRPAVEGDVDALAALAGAADRVDHPSWVTPREDIEEIFSSSWIDPARDTMVAWDAAGRALAAGWVTFNPARDDTLALYLFGAVHPDVRERGLGRELLRWQHERALEAVAEDGYDRPVAIFVYAEERNRAHRRIAERRGFAVERWFTSMQRDLALEVPEVAASLPVRIVPYDADLSEATRIARNDAFRDHWGSLETTPERWAQFVGTPYLRPDLSWLAVEGDRVVALALASVNEDDWAAQGFSSVYIDLIGVVRDRRRRGLAPAVIAPVLAAARDAGLDKAVLDVDTESPTGAHSLYTGLGFAPTERHLALVSRS